MSGSACRIAFSLQNSDSDQPSPSVQVSAEIKDGSGNAVGEIAQSEMAKPGMELYGVEDGTDPLKVALPEFGIKSIQQSTPVSGANNTLTVTLMANYHLGSGSRVTVSGLMGSQTADAAHLAVESTSDVFGTTGEWMQSSGQLVLHTAASGGMVAGSACVVTFSLQNSATTRAIVWSSERTLRTFSHARARARDE